MFDVRYLLSGLTALLAFCAVGALVSMPEQWESELSNAPSTPKQQLEHLVAWSLIEDTEVAGAGGEGATKDPVRVVAMRNLERFPGKGATIVLAMPAADYVVKIVSTYTGRTGEVGWRGNLTGLGRHYTVDYVESRNGSATASISTPEGDYVLRTVDGLGVLYPADAFEQPDSVDFGGYLIANAMSFNH
ncbi:hypothetical protein WKI13_07250 [Teredinibacter turnerae]|uniref:hypothetical protein n=1 Tax=Teredinibacter turnerae TaxID=2426 RepID=UPI00037B170F|nr:hypothetical protein [Teredinibacter turnerae]